MAKHVRVGNVSRIERTGLRKTKGYAKSRQDYDRRRRSSPLDQLGRVWRDLVRNDPCAYCPAPATRPSEDRHADHIVGLELGGRNEWENLTGACGSCNKSKRNQPLLLWMLGRLPRDDGRGMVTDG